MLSMDMAGGGRSSPIYNGGSVGNGVGAAVVGAAVVVFFFFKWVPIIVSQIE